MLLLQPPADSRSLNLKGGSHKFFIAMDSRNQPFSARGAHRQLPALFVRLQRPLGAETTMSGQACCSYQGSALSSVKLFSSVLSGKLQD